MENIVEWGPVPTPVSSGSPGELTSQQRRVLDQLRRHHDPVGVTVLAAELSLHHNTVREHLDVLIDRGRARRQRLLAGGRGRPSWLYQAMASTTERRSQEYLGLTAAFAEYLSATSLRPDVDGRAIGRAWGRQLAEADLATDVPTADEATTTDPEATTTDQEGTRRTSRRRLLRLLDQVGFGPEADPSIGSVALRQCPLLNAARAHPEVVCQVHHGLVVGALETYGDTGDHVRLSPFSEPHACRLRLDVEGQ